MSESPEIHVIYGTGALGKAVMHRLLSRGKQVRLVSRSGKASVPDGVTVVGGDAADPVSTRKACSGATVVYNCAAPPYPEWENTYPRIQEGLIEGAASAGARLVSAENMYVYGIVDGMMTEDTPHRPHTRKGKIRARMSADLMEAHKKGRVRATIGRAPDYYGPHAVLTTVYSGRVFNAALAGKKVWVQGKLDVPHTFIYVDDFAEGLVVLGEQEKAYGETWHLPSPPPLTQRDLLTMIFDEAKQKPRMGETPGAMFKALGLFIPLMRELAEMQYQWEIPYVVSHMKFEKAFGCDVTSHRDAIRETITWFRQNPQT